MLYLRKSDELNHWQVKFIVVKNIDALKNYIACDLHDHEEDVEVLFKFTDQSIELDLNPDKQEYRGWTVEPHCERCIIPYSQATSYGCSKISIPPKCYINVYGDITIPGYTKKLKYPLLLSGAVVLAKEESIPKVYIIRIMTEANVRLQGNDTDLTTNNEQDYLKVYDKFTTILVEVISNPSSLACRLKDDELISSDVEKKVTQMIPGVSNEQKAELLIKNVRNIISACCFDHNKQKQKLILFCGVLANSDPALSIVASEILKTAGIPPPP